MANHELMERSGDGVEVKLIWGDDPGLAYPLVVTVEDAEDFYCVPVPLDSGLDAFNHPFAYLARAQARAPKVAS